MKFFGIALIAMLSLTGVASANDGPAQEGFLPPHFGGDMIVVAALGLVAIVIFTLGYKVFDRVTPGLPLEEEVKKGNMAAATVMASIIIGLCVIMAVAIHAVIG